MLQKNSVIIKGSCEKPILIDTTFSNNNNNRVVIFSHGFKGFKDWGPFNKVAQYFAERQFVFVKFNFSHNGTSIEKPSDFVDLKAFGNNNFSKELDDLSLVIDWVGGQFLGAEIILFGHSRGGAISMLKTPEDNRISYLVSWASPSNLLSKLPDYGKLQMWADTNVAYVYNGRTKQNMPLYYQFFLDCMRNKERLNIECALKNIKIPHLHVHGDADTTVLIGEAHNIKCWNPSSQLHIIESANHVFNGFHPYNLDDFPKDLQQAIDVTIDFLD